MSASGDSVGIALGPAARQVTSARVSPADVFSEGLTGSAFPSLAGESTFEGGRVYRLARSKRFTKAPGE